MSDLPEQIQRLKQIVTEKANLQQQLFKLKQQLAAIEQQELCLTNILIKPSKPSPHMETGKPLGKTISSPNPVNMNSKKPLFSNPQQPSTSGLQKIKMPSNYEVAQPVKQSASTLTDADSDMELVELLLEEPTKCSKIPSTSESDAEIPLLELKKKKLKLKRKIVINSSDSEDGQLTKKSDSENEKSRKKSSHVQKKKKNALICKY
ncbi:unnamed protein product [Mytilus coruscus]|uniref:Uncharacterized protein n=1 Tax=Mytilus coruscus TaxID=42192 RepID=A0A6J8C537_MYTCO|nr:unnamed protein product [Mytilus coruscus]